MSSDPKLTHEREARRASSDAGPIARDDAETTARDDAEQAQLPAPWSDRERDLALAYEQGDFARVRKSARELAADQQAPDAVREHARDWSARVSVDVVVYAMLAFAFALFCAIVLRYALP